MKKIISVIIAIIIACLSLSSCSGREGGDVSNNTESGKSSKYTLYFGVHQEHDAGEQKAKFASTYVAVVCDKKGKIVDCVFDAVEDTVMLHGGIVEAGGDIQSKNELGLEYSMKSASAIGKEWYEQAEHFASFIKGRNINQVDDVDGGEAELMAGCTININGFKEAIDEADDEENGIEFESTSIPTAALGVFASREGSKDATSELDGIASMSTTYAAVAKNGEKIAAAEIEQIETKVYFDDSGLVIDLDENEGKRDMGYGYGMKAVSDIGLEWFEQVRNFEKYVIGKTPNEVAEIDMNGDYSADDALLAGCTIKISDFVKAISKTAG